MNKIIFNFFSFHGGWFSIIEYEGTKEDAMAEYQLAMEERDAYMAKVRAIGEKARPLIGIDNSKYIEIMNEYPPQTEIRVGDFILCAHDVNEMDTQDFDDFIEEMTAKRVDRY